MPAPTLSTNGEPRNRQRPPGACVSWVTSWSELSEPIRSFPLMVEQVGVLATAAAVGTPLLAFGGALAGGQVLSRRGARELDVRWRREETMRLLRWAAELAVDSDVGRGGVGLAALDALGRSELVQEEDTSIVLAVLDAVLARAAESYDETDQVEEAEPDAKDPQSHP